MSATVSLPLVYVRYLDHVLFKDMDPGAYSEPFIRETVGWLASENERAIQLIWERQLGEGATRQRATGLVILKADILELKRLGESHLYRDNISIFKGGADGIEGRRNDDQDLQTHPGPLEGAREKRRHLRYDYKPLDRRGEAA